MKRIAKNERTNEKIAAKRRRDRDGAGETTARSTEFSQGLRRSTAALALICGVCVGLSGCRSFLGADDERFRQGRGEYALNDEAILRDWERAAREMGGTARTGEIGENRKTGETGRETEKDPAASRPVLRSAAFDDEDAERRVVSRKPFSGSPSFAEPEAPKSFSERVKGLFSRPKKEETQRSTRSKNADLPVSSMNSGYSATSGNFAKSGKSSKTARSTESGFSLGRGLSNVFSSSKRRGREKFPVDPVLQYDESRFMPSFQTCEQYYAPLEPRSTTGRPLTSAGTLKSEKSAQGARIAQSARTSAAVASTTSKKRQNAPTKISGRELVALSESRRTPREDAFGFATSGGASRTSATGWGKTRPISVAANEEIASTKAPVAPVGYLNAVSKNETDFQTLTTRCDGFFGWETENEALLNAISEPTGEVGETLTAYSVAPSPSAPAFPAAELSAFAADVAEIAAAKESNAQLGKDASTLTAYAPTQETGTALQTVLPSSVASPEPNETTAEPNEVAETAQKSETAPSLTAYSPSATRQDKGARSDFASQLGETGFDWFDAQTQEAGTRPTDDAKVAKTGEVASSLPVAPSSVAETGEVASSLPVAPSSVAETGEAASSLPVAPISVAETGEAASNLPVAPSSVAGTGEVASSLPVAPSLVAETGEVASSWPVAPISVAEVPEVLTPVVAEALEVEAPQALVAVETGDAAGKENGVAGPNFALAAPGLGVGEAIQDAADERKNAAVAKPLSGDEIAWVEQIKGAIRTLVAERDAKKAAGEDVRRLDARLRLLCLAVDEYDRSIQEIQDDADPLKVFWETERGELETLLQSRLEEIDPTFVAERLRAGLDSLAGLCDLQIRKSALVVAPACFGLYEERAEGYKPGETVFAYAELEYVSCRETDEGRLIDVECRWRFLNADGSELSPVATQRCSNLSETKLRDVVLNVSAPLPNDLAPGTYLLETEVVDMNRPDAKPAKERLELTVVAGENVENAAE